MDVRLRAAVADDAVSVAALCRELRISRQTFYKWRARYRAEGLAGLEARSRAPRSSPQRVSAATEERIIELRKHLDELGVDAGPGTIQWHLGRAGQRLVPSEATIWRVLVRRGFVVPEPRKRPNTSWQRFVADRPNELWQTDFIEWVVADHSRVVHVLSFLDDHSRVALRCRAVPVATTDAAWETFSQAAACWGLPLGQLSDNGLCFSGKLRGVQVAFETHLRAAGVKPITSRPYHPQTCGKVERFHQTLKKWLRRKPLAADLDELQAQLDRFVDYYNHHRPHRSIGRRVPRRGLGRHPRSHQPRHHAPRAPPAPRPRPSTSADSPKLTASRSTSASNTPASPPPSTSTTPTPSCSPTGPSTESSNSTTAAATSPPASRAPRPYPDCQRCLATPLSTMSRDTTP